MKVLLKCAVFCLAKLERSQDVFGLFSVLLLKRIGTFNIVPKHIENQPKTPNRAKQTNTKPLKTNESKPPTKTQSQTNAHFNLWGFPTPFSLCLKHVALLHSLAVELSSQ